MPFKMIAVGNQYSYPQGSGTISWCIYGGNSLLERSYPTDRILNTPAVSEDGTYVATTGLQIAPGPAGEQVNGAVYLFDKQGQMLWSIFSSQSLFSTHINSNGSVIVASDPDLLYVNNAGKVIWNYTSFESTTVALVDNGSYVVDGISGVFFPNSSNQGSALVMFDSTGRTVWNISIPNQIFVSTTSLAVSNGHIATGVSSSGWDGTFLYYDLQGNLIWSKPVNSAILNVDFENDGSTIYVETNWGHVTFGLAGNMIENVTALH
jgi:PQQ-like domain